MCGIKTFCRAALRIGIVLLVVGASMLAASCGKDGSIYGAVTWDGTLIYASVDGFPSNGYANTYYRVAPGSYNVYYTLTDGTFYYPGYWLGLAYQLDPSYYWKCTYSVEADKGSFPMVDGKDRSFALYMAYEGMYKAGSVKSLQAPTQAPTSTAPKLGTQSWAVDGLLITVTNEIVKLAPEDIARIGKTQMEKK